MQILCIDRYPYIAYIDRSLEEVIPYTLPYSQQDKRKRLSDNALSLQLLNLTRIHTQDISEYLIGVLA